MNIDDVIKYFESESKSWKLHTGDCLDSGAELAMNAWQEAADYLEAHRTALEPELEVDATTFNDGTAELTWRNLSNGENFGMTVNVAPEQAKQIAKVMMPCGHYSAHRTALEPVLRFKIEMPNPMTFLVSICYPDGGPTMFQVAADNTAGTMETGMMTVKAGCIDLAQSLGLRAEFVEGE